MARETHFPNPQNKPQGYSPATKLGNIVFVSGQVSIDGDGNLVGEGDCGAQSEQCFKNVGAGLAAAGATWEDVTKITAFLVNVDEYPAYAAARLRRFPENGPASSSVIVKALVSPSFLVEIEAIAVLQ
jgi:enamine deaminase RidA (YjgF/YER057c/UK114 family)